MGEPRAKYFARSYLSIGMYRLRYNGLLWKPQRLGCFSRPPHPSTSNAGWLANCFRSRLQAFLYFHGLNL